MSQKKRKTRRGLLGRDVVNEEGVYFDETVSRKRSMSFEERPVDRALPYITFVMGGLMAWLFLIIVVVIFKSILSNLGGFLGGGGDPYRNQGIPFIGSRFLSIFLNIGFRWWVVLGGFLIGIIPALFVYRRLQKRLLANTGEELLDYEGDAKLATLPEMVAKYKLFPNKGAHTKGVDATAIVSHFIFDNRGIKKQLLPVLETTDGRDASEMGTTVRPVLEYNKTKTKTRVKRKLQPLMDPDEGVRMLKAIGMTDERYSAPHDPTKLYVMKNKKVTVADFVNDNWYVPSYETERPTGAYLVDDSPINVMVVAMTRGNKGQSYVNPFIDMVSRQEKQPNLFVNDPKGELYTAFYSTLKLRGYETVVFNLLDPAFTDQFNPLAQIVTYVRKGYKDEPQKLMKSLADNFFPQPDGADPIWTDGERMIFSMLAFLLIDFYYEKEQEYLAKYSGKVDEGIIQRDLDIMWQNVTLSNVYRMVTVFSTRKYREIDFKTGEYGAETDVNMMDKLFELTMELPKSNIRELFGYSYANLTSMAESEKMRSSMYGMALTDMSFFIEAPIIALTAASPRQSFDLVSMSFPRRFQFKIDERLSKDRGWIGQKVVFELYRDAEFKHKYEEKEYYHETRIDKLSWVEMRFEAILDQEETYVKMKILPRGTDGSMLYGEFYGMFRKGQKMDQSRRYFVKDPITGQDQIKDGVIYMGVLDENGVFDRHRRPMAHLSDGEEVPVISMTEVAYNEKPFAVFSVTPPSALTYVKIILMTIHMMFNTSVENSYMSKDDGKPLLKTKYILDEVGNLSYQGSGIDALTTKMSIGLAQGQEFTLILQTLQQITDVYGENRNRIIESNTGVTVYLLSSDLDMLRTMSEQAGEHHRVRYSNKGFTVTSGVMMNEVEDSISYSMSAEKEPLISVGRLLQMTNGEALVLSTTKRFDNEHSNVRQQPIFNTKGTSLPMSWYLHRHGYMQRRYSMLTVPTTNETISQHESIPPFDTFFKERLRQARLAPLVAKHYRKQAGVTEMAIESLSEDEREAYSHEIMRRVRQLISQGDKLGWEPRAVKMDYDGSESELGKYLPMEDMEKFVKEMPEEEAQIERTLTKDDKVLQAKREGSERVAKFREKKYANGLFSEDDLSLGQFVTAFTEALRHIDMNELQEPFELGYKGSSEILLFNDVEVAHTGMVEQEQTIETEDGVEVGREVARASSWVVDTSKLLPALRQLGNNWRGVLGDSFMDALQEEFRVRASNAEAQKLQS